MTSNERDDRAHSKAADNRGRNADSVGEMQRGRIRPRSLVIHKSKRPPQRHQPPKFPPAEGAVQVVGGGGGVPER
eukprot:CAMPEP_0198573658 /NCGR_PEP_ID=MMETSP1462-20131121/113525_1 /TAXON_ID=1333877 /ORGANISM="Brandtodinium nutriculum, Strain RCC3387" /LENGTH=74 /DNA_ID=CAMNT_0044304849 /DNA_START=72 /DNA_END=291 /DNA_ORIENTATION=-